MCTQPHRQCTYTPFPSLCYTRHTTTLTRCFQSSTACWNSRSSETSCGKVTLPVGSTAGRTGACAYHRRDKQAFRPEHTLQSSPNIKRIMNTLRRQGVLFTILYTYADKAYCLLYYIRTGSPPSLLSNGERRSPSMGWSGIPKRIRRLLEAAIVYRMYTIYTRYNAKANSTKSI